jgi:DtxR family Mn-dependent transcriptional regulator
MNLSRTQQDYLKTVWNIIRSGQSARIKTVAEMLKVKPPTVISMFHQLGHYGLLTYDRSKGAQLTGVGYREAEQLIRKHRLIETFLQEVLSIEEPLLHDEAEKLEHVMSDKLIMRIDEFLNYPSIDPHGSIIPLSDPGSIKYTLNEMEPEIAFRVSRIPMAGKENVFCSENNFVPGSKWKIVQIGPQEESYLVTNGKKYIAISDHMAEKITVTIFRNE